MKTDEGLEKLWEAFGDVPVGDDDAIETDFLHWPRGTDRFEIWHWFDDHHSKGIAQHPFM